MKCKCPNSYSVQRPRGVKVPQGIKCHGVSKCHRASSATGRQRPQGVKGYGASKAKESEVWATKGHRASKTMGHQRLRGVKGRGASKCHRASKATGRHKESEVWATKGWPPRSFQRRSQTSKGLNPHYQTIFLSTKVKGQRASNAKGLQRPWVVIKSQRSGSQKAGLQGHFDGGLRRQKT